MIHIGMFCFAGMSTSVLVSRMNEYAAKKGIANKAKDLDIVLIGPQIKYMRKRIEQICSPLNVKVMVVSNVDFGRMDAAHVLDEALKLIEAV